MSLAHIAAASLDIRLRTVFRHASAARGTTAALWIEATGTDGERGHGEGTPRDYVTGETVAGAARFVAGHRAAWVAGVPDAQALVAWADRHTAAIDANPAAWCAVELALLDLFGRQAGCTVDALLGLPPLSGRAAYTAVLGDGPPQAFRALLGQYLAAGFADFKIKLSGDIHRDAAKVHALRAAGVAPTAVRADANNLWRDADAAIAHLRALAYPFRAIEEPLAAGDVAGMRRVAHALDTRIVLDESLVHARGIAPLARDAGTWIANVRVSKMGGLARALSAVAGAAAAGIDVIVGAHVGETSVLTRAGLTVAARAAACGRLVAREGAFGTRLLAHDVVDAPIAFGAGGLLDVDSLPCARAPGLGFAIRVRPGDLSGLPDGSD